MDLAIVYIALAAAFGLFMAWGIGANDVANAMAPSVGSKAITIRQAIVIAAIFEFAGAVLAGGGVTSTIRKGIVDAALFTGQPELLIYGMLASLLAAAVWLLVASRFGWPVSTTHTIIGAVVGFAAIGIGVEAVQWPKVGQIAMSWVVSPLLAGAIAWVLFMSVQRLVLEREDPLRQARRYVPGYIFLAGLFMTLVTLFKGVKHIGLEISVAQSWAIAVLVGLIIAGIGTLFILRIPYQAPEKREFHYVTVERIFAILMVVTACSMAFAHGSNDVANAVGPLAAVVSIARSGDVGQAAIVPIWILILGGLGIVIGLATYGHRVIRTVGGNITALTPSRGFAAGLAAAMTIVVASGTGLPISTTHTVVGAILGVGMARGIAAINLRVVGSIFMSWIITIPAGAGLSVVFFLLFRALFQGAA
ncbi:inorganic phosphate transporter [Wenzhouxiangella marina]|uniref:Phosphate transporter n=1 Tax=Wenzhouxiangella marina TaxID=1579979 RepID=A0A0K0XY23_9GAMM|nr:inorganic phosphate transporter [Wenzhouxiangella marina]AKS42511.1 Phosphate transporter [Wenzhouxiangella marina]MBB6085713.1 PiT family inorganic phosphate transporter [Wenzhouxiangella marina]